MGVALKDRASQPLRCDGRPFCCDEVVRDHSGKMAVKTSIKHKVDNARRKTSLLVALKARQGSSNSASAGQLATPHPSLDVASSASQVVAPSADDA